MIPDLSVVWVVGVVPVWPVLLGRLLPRPLTGLVRDLDGVGRSARLLNRKAS